MAGKPYQSCLIPYEAEIVALRRRKPPMPFSQIAEFLREKYQITIRRESIYSFIKIRARGFKPCKYAWSIDPATTANIRPAPETPTLERPLSSQTPSQRISDKPKPAAVISQLTDFEMPFSETYNLHRLSPEDAAALLKQIEEEREKERSKQ